MNLLSRIYIINDLSDLSHMCTLHWVGYNFSFILVVQGIKCVINFFFQKKRRNLCVVNQNIVSKFNWISYIVPWMNRNYACMLTIAVGFWWSCRICKRVMGLEKITTDQTRIWSWSPINSTLVITFDLVLLSQFSNFTQALDIFSGRG